MKITIRCFAGVREVLGTPHLALQLPDNALAGSVLSTLSEQYPALRPLAAYVRIAVNNTYASAEAPLHEGDEVALIPPVAGG